jgi:hypothetical protein
MVRYARISVRLLSVIALSAGLGAARPTMAASAHAAKADSMQSVSGRVVSMAGKPVAGETVTIFVQSAVGGSSPVLGHTSTRADGRWSFPVPAYLELPKAAQQAATSDMGYLNVDIIATASARLGGHT